MLAVWRLQWSITSIIRRLGRELKCCLQPSHAQVLYIVCMVYGIPVQASGAAKYTVRIRCPAHRSSKFHSFMYKRICMNNDERHNKIQCEQWPNKYNFNYLKDEYILFTIFLVKIKMIGRRSIFSAALWYCCVCMSVCVSVKSVSYVSIDWIKTRPLCWLSVGCTTRLASLT